jgi:regulator of sigma E protease
VTPNAEGLIGIRFDGAYCGPTENERFSFFEALPIGIRELKISSVLFFTNIYKIIIGKASFRKSVGGPVTIAKMAKESAETGVAEFFGLIGLLSISLALLNILPFPALDGGHLAFLGFEAVFRREIPVKIKIVIQQVGFVLLLVFMAFVIYNDIVRF